MAEAMRRQAELRPRAFSVGDLVFVERGQPRVGHKQQPKGTGPWEVMKVFPDGSAVTLRDPETKRPKLDDLTSTPEKVATRRLLRFTPPVPLVKSQSSGLIKARDVVAWSDANEILLMEVETASPGEGIFGHVLSVPPLERYGGVARRPWLRNNERQEVKWQNILLKVKLKADSTLDGDSLESLMKYMDPNAQAMPIE